MSEIRRAYDLLRGYVNSEWDRIKSVDLDRALDELDTPAKKTSKDSGALDPAEETYVTPANPKELASSILSVEPDASFEDIKKAFDKLNKRSNPANFPEGSEEAKNAARIQARVNWAYRVLCEDKSDSERRFKSLEID